MTDSSARVEEPVKRAPLRLGEATRAAFEALRTAVWVFDVERKRMHWANRASLRVWNAPTLDELLARDFASDMSRSTETRLRDYLDRFRRGEVVPDRWTFYPKDSPLPVTVLSQASGVELEDGRLAMLFEATRSTLDSLEADKLRMIEVLRNTTGIVTVFTAEGRVLLQNPASIRVHGNLADDKDRALSKLVGRYQQSETAQRAVEQALLGRATVFDTRVECAPMPCWHSVKMCPARDPVSSAPCVLVDESNIDRLHAVQERNLWLERDAAEKRMAGGFAHEVRNALAGARIALEGTLGDGGALDASAFDEAAGELQAIYERVAPSLDERAIEPVLNSMARIQSSSDRVECTVRMVLTAVLRTLDLTQRTMQLSKAGHEHARVPVDLSQVLRAIAESSAEEFARHRITLRIDGADEPVIVIGVEGHFHSIFSNLVRNARDAVLSPELGDARLREVIVSLTHDEGAACVRVRDSGTGIDERVRARMFEPFFTTKAESGTGLGLALVQRYVELHGGAIHVESEPGRFTAFDVTIPLARPDAGEPS